MTREDLIAVREAWQFTQAEMARILGMSERGYQKLEAGDSQIRTVHMLAVNYAGIMVAVSSRNINAAPANARNYALQLASLITGQEPPAAQ